jgi:SSS family solute:Na+ symporter
MKLTLLDWGTIAAYFIATLLLGLYFRRRSGRSTEDYFVSGRKVTWWLAGTSMVATTFAADTPLWVAGEVYEHGIAGNWLWWAFLPSGMMTVFLFARLWRRSGLLTDVQFAELRYGGKPAAFLRGFRAIYLGLLMNCLILGWVTKAMVSILAVSLDVSENVALLICVLGIIPFTGFYVSLGGLWGVLWTDLFQFVLMMAIVISVGYFAVDAAGGMTNLLAEIERMRNSSAVPAADPLAFFPDFSRGWTSEAIWTLPVLAFVAHIAVQWWAFWYPGAEPGGGGYIAQRIFSAKDERHGLLSVLWFNIAHYALRPWPWILAGLAAIVLYPGMDRAAAERSYMEIATTYMPPALRGLVLAGFLAAFMSTVATQLNWGASYLVNDFYRRYIRSGGSEPHYVRVGRLVTLLLVFGAALVSILLTNIAAGWQAVLEIGAGTGLVYLLRWYWWRINAWSEIAAMVAALACFIVIRIWSPFTGSGPVVFAKAALITTLLTTPIWLVVTFLTRPETDAVLERFYREVQPDVRGWKPVARRITALAPTYDLGRNLLNWLLGCVMVYAALFGVGKIIFLQYGIGAVLLLVAIGSAWLLYANLSRQSWELGGRAASYAPQL